MTKEEVVEKRGKRRRIEFLLPGHLYAQFESLARKESKSMTVLLLEILAKDPRLEVLAVDFVDLRRRRQLEDGRYI